MKRTFLFSILAVIPAVLMPLAATSQVAPTRAASSGDRDDTSYKYTVYAGYAYTSLNQVNQSRAGLQGVDFTVTRNIGKYFGIFGDGAYYDTAFKSTNPCPPSNPATPLVPITSCTPTVTDVFFGPEFHGYLYAHTSGFVRVLLGGEHTGGEVMKPNISFAGGLGGGLEYQMSKHFSIRASGDDIAASFTLVGDYAQYNYSPHMTRDARATFGVAYKF